MRKTLRLYDTHTGPLCGMTSHTISSGRVQTLPTAAGEAMVFLKPSNVITWTSDIVTGTGAIGPIGATGPTGPKGYGLSVDSVVEGDTISVFTTTTMVRSGEEGSIMLPINARNGAQKTIVYTVTTGECSTPIESNFVSGGETYTKLCFQTSAGSATLVYSTALSAWVVVATIAATLS